MQNIEQGSEETSVTLCMANLTLRMEAGTDALALISSKGTELKWHKLSTVATLYPKCMAVVFCGREEFIHICPCT